MHWLHHRCYMDEHKVCSVTSEPSQSKSRRVEPDLWWSQWTSSWRGTVSKSCFTAELSSHCFVHFGCVPIYIYIYIYSDTAHIVFIHITSVVKIVHIFMARNRVSESCLIAELYFYRFVRFGCVPLYSSVFTTSSVLEIRRTSILWSIFLKYSVALKSPQRTKRVCYCSKMVR